MNSICRDSSTRFNYVQSSGVGENPCFDTASPLRHGDGVADATEGVVAAIAAAGGDDEVVFAAGDRVVKDDFSGDGVAFEVLRQGMDTNWRQYII